ncbi:MAG: hypothetical protein LBI19_04545 [Oscillospiraceae bacterium]|jgi:hypothetical protein|nr:hypothetical protein [Oscillospiraceae bacterium]
MMKRIISFLFATVVLVFAFPLTASADLGPKSTLTIIVKNPPSEAYYLDLLVTNISYRYEDDPMTMPDTNDKRVQGLYSYIEEGWYPALYSHIPYTRGDLTGTSSAGVMQHNFLMAPAEFKIIIVTQSGEVIVSDIITRNKFFSEIVYNVQTGKASENTVDGFAQFPFTLAATLVIEGLLLLLFRFKLRDNWKPFLLVNAGTQAFLYFSLMGISASSAIFAILAQPLLEIAIIAIECAIYAKTLKGQSRGRIISYAVIANLASWFFGWLLQAMVLSVFNRIFI